MPNFLCFISILFYLTACTTKNFNKKRVEAMIVSTLLDSIYFFKRKALRLFYWGSKAPTFSNVTLLNKLLIYIFQVQIR